MKNNSSQECQLTLYNNKAKVAQPHLQKKNKKNSISKIHFSFFQHLNKILNHIKKKFTDYNKHLLIKHYKIHTII